MTAQAQQNTESYEARPAITEPRATEPELLRMPMETAREVAPKSKSLVYAIPPIREEIEIEWLIGKPKTYTGLLPKRSITVFSGDSGSGKSWLAYSLADAVSNGKSFLGMQSEKTPVLYVDGENPEAVVSTRTKLLNITDLSNLKYLGLWVDIEGLIPSGPDNEHVESWVKNESSETVSPLIVFDTWAQFYQGDDPNNEAKVRDTYRKYKNLTKLGATVVILLHSTEKTGSGGFYRGTTALKDGADMAYKIESNINPDSDEEQRLSRLNIIPWKSRVVPGLNWKVEFEDGVGFSGQPVESKGDLHNLGKCGPKGKKYNVTHDAEKIAEAFLTAPGSNGGCATRLAKSKLADAVEMNRTSKRFKDALDYAEEHLGVTHEAGPGGSIQYFLAESGGAGFGRL